MYVQRNVAIVKFSLSKFGSHCTPFDSKYKYVVCWLYTMSFPPHLPPGVEAIDTTGDASSKNPKSPLKLQQMVYLESESRPKFDVFAKVLAESTSSSVLSQEAWNERVFIVKHWDTGATVNGELLNVSAFRRAYPTGYPLTKKLYVTTNSTGVSHLWVRDLSTPDPDKPEKTKGDRMLAHTAQMFDIIKFVHVKLSMHLKSDRTWNTIKDSYANIPRKLVAKYVKLCPICSGKCPVVHPPQGSHQTNSLQRIPWQIPIGSYWLSEWSSELARWWDGN